MQLIRVEFDRFRSIKGEALDVERDITCLVGINESGKSNALSAIQKADEEQVLESADFSRHDDDFGKPEIGPSLSLHFVPRNEEEKKKLGELIGRKVEMLILSKEAEGYSLMYPNIEYKKSSFYTPPEETAEESGNDESEESEDEDDIREKIIEALIEDHLPKFLIFDSVNFNEFFLPLNGEILISKFLLDPDEMRPVKNLLELGGISDFQTLIATTEDERIRRDKMLGETSGRINERIFKVVWPVKTVEVKLSAESDLLKIRLHESGSTSPFKPGERSRGLQWSLAFNIYFLAATRNDLKSSVLLIDEPGVFLHVDAQNKLLEKTFPQIVKTGDQVIYTTHLPYLIDPHFPERIRILEKVKEDTQIGNKAWSEGEFGALPEPVKTALGLKWSEVLNFGPINLLVEGPSDLIIIREMHAIFGSIEIPTIIPSYGATKMPTPLALARVEEKIAFGLIDSDADIKKIRERVSIANVPPGDIENLAFVLKNKKIMTTEDIVPADLYKKAIERVYAPICSRRNNCGVLDSDEIPTTHPRVAKTEEFFATKFKATKHKLLKMEVARAMREILKENPTKGSTDKWGTARSLIKWIETQIQDRTGSRVV